MLGKVVVARPFNSLVPISIYHSAMLHEYNEAVRLGVATIAADLNFAENKHSPNKLNSLIECARFIVVTYA